MSQCVDEWAIDYLENVLLPLVGAAARARCAPLQLSSCLLSGLPGAGPSGAPARLSVRAPVYRSACGA